MVSKVHSKAKPKKYGDPRRPQSRAVGRSEILRVLVIIQGRMKEEILFLFLPKLGWGVIATPPCTLVSYGPAGSACATSKTSWSRGWWFSAGP